MIVKNWFEVNHFTTIIAVISWSQFSENFRIKKKPVTQFFLFFLKK